MPKYLFEVNYVGEGIKGLLKDGGSARVDAARKLMQSVGGSLESLYFAFGDIDAFAVADLPDDASAAAVALTASASGAIKVNTRVLLVPEEVDAASKKGVDYTPPGARRIGRKRA
jgi:uncharacterized protein with GYD domain